MPALSHRSGVPVLLITLAACLLLASPSAGRAAAPSSAVTCTGHWELVPDNVSTNVDLFAIAALRQDDACAVGTDWDHGGRALGLHWDGSSWTKIFVPTSPQGYETVMRGIFAVADDDLWTIGDDGGTLISHWDGAAWTTSRPHNAFTHQFSQLGIVGPKDVWAVGQWIPQSGPYQQGPVPLIEHWGGWRWREFPQPIQTPGALNGIAVVAPDDIWAVGFEYILGAKAPFEAQALVEHWDGTSWTVVTAPGKGENASLNDVKAVGPDDIWAVGGTGQDRGSAWIEHWDGVKWTMDHSAYGPEGRLTSLVLTTPGAGWAVGYYLMGRHYVGTLDHLSNGAWRTGSEVSGYRFDALAGVHGVVWATADQGDRVHAIAVRCHPGSFGS